MQIRSIVVLLLALTIAPATAAAASFDCEKATTDIERLVCADREISHLDDQLNEVYGRRLAESPYLRESQLDWLAARDACQDRDCVVGLYVRRINFLLPPGEEIPEPASAPAIADTPMTTALDLAPLHNDADAGVDTSPIPQELPEQGEMQGLETRATSVSTPASQGVAETLSPTLVEAGPTDPPRAPAIEPKEPTSQLLLLTVLASALCVLCLLALSLFGKIVFYYDGRDFAWSLSPAIAAVVTALVVAISHQGNAVSQLTPVQICIIALASCVAALGVWKGFYNAVLYNRSLAIGLLVGACKTMVSAFMVFSFLANSGRKHGRDYYKNNETGRRERAAARSSFAMLGLLWFALVNGERVYEKKGWELPVD